MRMRRARRCDLVPPKRRAPWQAGKFLDHDRGKEGIGSMRHPHLQREVCMDRPGPAPARVVGRYAVFDIIAAGGMATVHFGRLLGPAGSSRTVVVKRLHAQFAADPELCAMLLDEANCACSRLTT